MVGPGACRFGNEEREQVLEVLESGHFSRYGDLADPGFKHKVYDLEVEFAALCGSPHALATNSGTSALVLALLAAGIGEGDEVLVPGFTYVATYAAIVHTRAVPVLVEIDESLTLDVEDLRRKVTDRTRAVLAVHMLGVSCAMQPIMDFACAHHLTVIEDVCQAAGGSYFGRRLGTFGELAAFSMNRYKMMSAGEGGMILTHRRELYERAFALHDQGHRPLRANKEQPDRSMLGLNFKMNELTGAVALAQLRKLNGILATLRDKKRRLAQMLPEVRGVRPRRIDDPAGECATFLTFLFDDLERAKAVASQLGVGTLQESGWHNYRLMEHLANHRTALPEWSPPSRYARPGDLPATDRILASTLNVSIGVVDRGLAAEFGININSTDVDIVHVADVLTKALRGVSAA